MNAERLAADVLDDTPVLLMDGLHDEPYQHRTLAAKLLQINLHRIVWAVYARTVMNEVRHLHVQKQRLIGILDIKGVKSTVLRDHTHVRLLPEVLDRRFYTDDVLRPICLSCNEVGRTQIHIAYSGGEDDVHRLVVGDFQAVRRYHTLEGDFTCQSLIEVSA